VTDPDLRRYLDELAERFEQPAFIADDPIAVPHGFDDPRDQEVIGLFSALLAWGQRRTVLNKMAELSERMRYRPFEFVRDFRAERDAEQLLGFKHRTFQETDAVWFMRCLSELLRLHGSVEAIFSRHIREDEQHVGRALQGFSDDMLTALPDVPVRLRKHLARPSTGSACKRLNMYLRWMVRPGPVDFGIWTSVRPDQLLLPLDVHSGRQARLLGMLSRTQDDFPATLELSAACRAFRPEDPARYDYAFFGAGIYRIDLDPRFTSEKSAGGTSSPTDR
jgi:uncharacterized protein (TIGR02757 family)